MFEYPYVEPDEGRLANAVQVGAVAADHWFLSRCELAQPQARIFSGYLEEALRHLIEVGLVTINDSADLPDWMPTNRTPRLGKE